MAALVVLVYHCLLCVPALAPPVNLQTRTDPIRGASDFFSVEWWLRHSPLKLLWSGPEAVYVFFVLSGLVLVLPALRSNSFTWRAYYPRRLVRIYLPVFATMAFALGLLLLVPRVGEAGLSPWVLDAPRGVSISSFIKNALLLSGMESLVGPLWSLRYEMGFSLMLPAYVLVVRKAPVKLRMWLTAAAFAGASLGQAADVWPVFFPFVFAIGAMMSVQIDDMRTWWGRLGPVPRALVVVATALALVAPWLVSPWVDPSVTRTSGALPIFGAAAAVMLALSEPRIVMALQSRWVQAAGAVSFSLYLVHEPIVIAAAFWLGPGNGWWVLPTAGPMSIVAALIFLRLVERPSHHLAQSLMRRPS